MADVRDDRGLLQRMRDVLWNTRAQYYNINNPAVPIGGEVIDYLFDGPPSKSGINVTPDNALTVSALWRGIQVLGGAASSIPFKGYKKTDGGRVELTEKDVPAISLITNRPNKKVTWPVFIDRAINHLHMRGNHFAYIERNGFGQCVGLHLWHPDTVEVYETETEVYYKRKNEKRVYGSDEVIHVPHLGDGILGKSVVKYAKEDLGLEMSRRDYGSSTFDGGGKPGGLISSKQPLNETQRKQLADNWAAIKKDNKGKDIVLPFAMDYQYATFKPEEMEWLQAGDFTIPTISRWIGVPPHKLYDLTRATFSNIEHQGIEFVSDTMAPILVKFEYEYTDKIFQLDIERKRGYYLEFNLGAYIRADLKTRMEANAIAIHSGQLTPKEARDMENRPVKEGSDRLFMNQGSGPLDRMDDIIDNKKTKPVSAEAKAKLKAMFNGKTQDILDILEE